MRACLTATLMAMMLCSSCTALDQNTSKPTKTKPLTRATTFAKRVAGTLTELTRDVLPDVGAMTDEAFGELRGDLVKVREEWSSQMSRPLPSKGKEETP